VVIGGRLSNDEFRSVAAFLRKYPRLSLAIIDYVSHKNLDFLAHFPTVRSLYVCCLSIEDISGIGHLGRDLAAFSLGPTVKKRFSLSPLERFTRLGTLSLHGQMKDIEVIGKLTALRRLVLRSITLPNLKLLLPLRRLERFELKLGATRDLRELPDIGRLRYFEAFLVRGLADLAPVAALPALECLFLQALKRVTTLPSFRAAAALRWVILWTMTGLKNLAPLAEAPELRSLVAYDMGHLAPEAFRPFVGHRTLKAARIGLGSDRKNEAVDALLPLSSPGTLPARYR
jgi:internalin A